MASFKYFSRHSSNTNRLPGTFLSSPDNFSLFRSSLISPHGSHVRIWNIFYPVSRLLITPAPSPFNESSFVLEIFSILFCILLSLSVRLFFCVYFGDCSYIFWVNTFLYSTLCWYFTNMVLFLFDNFLSCGLTKFLLPEDIPHKMHNLSHILYA